MQEILEELKKTPVVIYVCAKTGICRASFYRWQQEDKEFAENVKEATNIGLEELNDYCETKLITKIKQGNMQAIVFWLKHHKKIYKQKSYIVVNNLCQAKMKK